MFGIVNYAGFAAAGILLNLTPGADTVYILTQSAASGRRAGVISALGIASGILVHTALVAAGLAAVLASSPAAFSVLKMAGALYLFYLGIKAFREKEGSFMQEGAENQKSFGSIYRQAILTNVLNPKVALFFLAFLPAFVDPEAASGMLPFLILGLTFFSTALIWNTILAVSASAASRFLQKNRSAGKYAGKVSGVIYGLLGLGVLMSKA